jgi:hypothetical protein
MARRLPLRGISTAHPPEPDPAAVAAFEKTLVNGVFTKGEIAAQNRQMRAQARNAASPRAGRASGT